MESLDSPVDMLDSEAPVAAPALLPMAAAAGAALALAACDGGGSTGGNVVTPVTPVAPTPTPTAAAITKPQASRFLAQATMGANSTAIADVQSRGYDGWISAQFATARPDHALGLAGGEGL